MLRNPMRLSWILTIITSTLLFSGYSAWAQTPLTDCDRLAANTTDARKHSSAPGVPFKQVRENVNAALSACADAVKSFPNELRFQYQYARALQIRDKKSASQLFVKLSENGYPAAFDNVGWIQISENNDYDAAIRAFRKGYDLGDADCAVSLFEMIEREKWKPDNEKQVRITLLEKAAAANHAGAVVALPIERAKHGTASNDLTAAAPKPTAAPTEVKSEDSDAIKRRITAEYRRREKTLLEQVANYTSFGKEGGGAGKDDESCPNHCWIQIEHCVVARERFKYDKMFKPQTIIIDFRKFNQTAFRIESYVSQGYGERAAWNIGAFTGSADDSYALIKYDSGITVITTSSIPTSGYNAVFNVSFPSMDRLSKAWGLAFKECPGKKSSF